MAQDRETTDRACTLGDLLRAQLRLRRERAGAIASVYAKRAMLKDDDLHTSIDRGGARVSESMDN
jgi:hypothetical protein